MKPLLMQWGHTSRTTSRAWPMCLEKHNLQRGLKSTQPGLEKPPHSGQMGLEKPREETMPQWDCIANVFVEIVFC